MTEEGIEMLRLESIEYVERPGTPLRWQIEGLVLGGVNLIVGKNASGKSRTLSLVTGLGNMLCGASKMVYDDGRFSAVLNDGSVKTEYVLRYKQIKIIEETLTIDGKRMLTRGPGGVGKIYMTQEKKLVSFQTPDNELAVVARRDSVQNQFFEPLNEWGEGVILFEFGKTMGHTSALVKDEVSGTVNVKKTAEAFLEVYEAGVREFGSRYTKAIVKDMECLGYNIQSMNVGVPDMKAKDKVPFPFRVMKVRETELRAPIDHLLLSQGMFRALSLVVQVNYDLLSKKASCIVVDDVGEGLDYERSAHMVELLRSKAEKAEVQLIMATNDRYIMNGVPLDMWSVISREGWRCRVYNKGNARKAFEEFKSTGMSNFDFLAFDYYSKKA